MTDFDSEVYEFKTAQSTSIDFNNGVISSAKLTATIVSTDVYVVNFYLSADGGAHWEEVQNGITHTFVSTGEDLRWKITGSGGFYISKIIIGGYH